jgi:hypothetical protein
VAGGLLVVENAGRRRNYRLADPEVAVLIEALERLAPTLPIRSLGQSQQARAWRQARVCYDHIAGVLGVELMRSLLDQGRVGPGHEPAGADPGQARYFITSGGTAFLETLGIAIPSGRQPVRHHMDSTEDGSHISGVLGRALLTGFADLGWLQRHQNRRLRVTPQGREGFGRRFGISLGDLPASSGADHPPRDEQCGHQQPDQPPSAEGDNEHQGRDHQAGQRGPERRCHPAGRRQRPGAGGAGGRDLRGGPDGGEIGPELGELTVGSRGQRPPGSLVELRRRQPARLEVLAQLGYDRVAVGVRRPHRSRKIMSSHGAHRFSLVRPVLS